MIETLSISMKENNHNILIKFKSKNNQLIINTIIHIYKVIILPI